MLAYVKGTVELYLRALAREVGPLCSSGSWNLIFIEMDFNGMEIMMALDFYSRYHSIVNANSLSDISSISNGSCNFVITIFVLCHVLFCYS